MVELDDDSNVWKTIRDEDLDSNEELKVSASNFEKWIKKEYPSRKSEHRYALAVKKISNDMLSENKIDVSLFEVPLSKIDELLQVIRNDASFKTKDKTGNRFYSRALKLYRDYIASINENE